MRFGSKTKGFQWKGPMGYSRVPKRGGPHAGKSTQKQTKDIFAKEVKSNIIAPDKLSNNKS